MRQQRNKFVFSHIGLFSLTRSPSLFFETTSSHLCSLIGIGTRSSCLACAWYIFETPDGTACALVPVPTPDCIEFAIVQLAAIAAGNWALLPLLLERLAGAPQCDAMPADEESQTSPPPSTSALPPPCCDEAPPPPPPRSQKDPLVR